MRILITGATGFLGTSLIAYLKDHEVFAVVRRPPKTAENTRCEHVAWIEADLGCGFSTTALPAKMDGIIHLAQSARFREFPDGASDVFAVNVAAAQALTAWGAKAGVSSAVFASTGTVYEPFRGELTESAAAFPTGYYAASKLAAESLTSAYSSHMSVAHLRLFFLYGPKQKNMMISRLVETVRSGTTVTLPSVGGGLVLAPTYVTDAAQIFMRACVEGWGGIWNLSGAEVVSFEELAIKIGAIANRPPLFVRSGLASAPTIVPDLTKLRGIVDLKSFVSLEDGLERTLRAM